MNIIDVEKVEIGLKDALEELKKKYPEYEITMDSCKKKENNGTIYYVFHAKKNSEKRPNKVTISNIGMYIFESKGKVTTFIINGRTMEMLFENCTINSPIIAIHYLKDILSSEIDWLVKIQKTLSERKKPVKNFKSRGNSNESKSDGKNFNKNSGYHKTSHNKSYDKNKSYSGKPPITTYNNRNRQNNNYRGGNKNGTK